MSARPQRQQLTLGRGLTRCQGLQALHIPASLQLTPCEVDTIGPSPTVQTKGQGVSPGSLAPELCSEPRLSAVSKSPHMHGIKIWEERLQNDKSQRECLSELEGFHFPRGMCSCTAHITKNRARANLHGPTLVGGGTVFSGLYLSTQLGPPTLRHPWKLTGTRWAWALREPPSQFSSPKKRALAWV